MKVETLRVYLLRHGHALESYEDPARPLSPLGRAQVEAVARLAATRPASPARALASPKLRARQTAEILLAALAVELEVDESERLLPNAPVAPWVSRLSDEEGDPLLVGHNPFMEELAATLTDGQGPAFGTATLACLERGPTGRWRLLWTEEAPPREQLGF